MESGYIIIFCALFSFCSTQDLPCSQQLSVDISDGKEVALGVFLKDNVTYNHKNYFVSNGTRYGCICNIVKCIRKCCQMSEEMSTNKTCTKNSDSFNLSFYNEREMNPKVGLDDYHIIHGFVLCPSLQTEENEEILMQENGSLFNSDWEELYNLDSYCVDTFNEGLSAYVCLSLTEYEEIEQQRQLTGIGMIISMPFLLATFMVYFILPERNFHRRALMFYVMADLGGNIVLVAVNNLGKLPPVLCHLTGYLIIFFFLVSFFWLNSMCIDMWLAFSSWTGLLSKNTSDNKKFRIYCIYTLAVPTLMVLLVVLLNTYGDEHSDYHPNIGITSCSLSDGWPQFYYFYLPIGLLVGFNSVLFIFTSLKIFKIKKETRMLKRTDSKVHQSSDDKQKFNLYLKLMFAMGVNWTMELVTWAVIWRYGTIPRAVYYLTDFINALYGVFIFFIFVFKRKIWKSLKKSDLETSVTAGKTNIPEESRYYKCIGKPDLVQTTSSRRSTRTSNYSTSDASVTNYDFRLHDLRNEESEETALNRA